MQEKITCPKCDSKLVIKKGSSSPQTSKSALSSPKLIKILAKLGWRIASHFRLLFLAKFGVIPKPILLVILVFFS